MVSRLPDRPNLDQLRRQAKELRDAAAAGDPRAVKRLLKFGANITLSTAQLAIARRYGFSSWPRLNVEVRRKQLISSGDVAGLRSLLREHPGLVVENVSSKLSSPSASALQYVAVARFHGALDHDAAAGLTQVLLESGADPDGPAETDSPLVTAASYGEMGMVEVLLAAGADLERRGDSIPGGGSALSHAVYYGMPAVVDVLIRAGAVPNGLVDHAGVGPIPDDVLQAATHDGLVLALRAATVCERMEAINQVLGRGIDVNADIDGATALHWAAWQAKADSIAHLLERGADPTRRDAEHEMTARQWYLFRRGQLDEINNPECWKNAARIEQLLAGTG